MKHRQRKVTLALTSSSKIPQPLIDRVHCDAVLLRRANLMAPSAQIWLATLEAMHQIEYPAIDPEP